MLDLQVAHTRVVAIDAVRLLLLIQDRRRHRPAIVQVDLERGAAAISFGVVEVFFDEGGIVHDDPAGKIGRRTARPRTVAESARSGNIADEPCVALVETDNAERHIACDWQVDHAFKLTANAALGYRVDFAVNPARCLAKQRLVGDDTNGAGFRRSAVKRALWSRKALDTGNIINMDIKRAADRRHWLFVQIGTDRRERSRVIAVTARRDTAHINNSCSRGRALKRYRR